MLLHITVQVDVYSELFSFNQSVSWSIGHAPALTARVRINFRGYATLELCSQNNKQSKPCPRLARFFLRLIIESAAIKTIIVNSLASGVLDTVHPLASSLAGCFGSGMCIVRKFWIHWAFQSKQLFQKPIFGQQLFKLATLIQSKLCEE